MNTKQFVSSLVFFTIDSIVNFVSHLMTAFKTRYPRAYDIFLPFARLLQAIPFRILFPNIGYRIFKSSHIRPSVFIAIYCFGLFICFFVQAFLADMAGHLGKIGDLLKESNAQDRVMFLSDGHNLFNYVVVVPLYLVAGIGYIISLYSLEERIKPFGFDRKLTIDDSHQPLLAGGAAIFVFILIWMITQTSYAFDVTSSSKLFWFHGISAENSLSFNGYFYIMTNVLLGGFVLFVALLHLELFRWSSTLTKSIRSYASEEASCEGIFCRNSEDELKKLFAPFTETAIWSKAFAVALAVNIYTWLASGISGHEGGNQATEATLFFKVVTVLYYVIALWIVSLPRYRVQYEIFQLRKKKGIHEYLDIRMPWAIGWSVFINLVLLGFFSTAIFGTGNIIDFFLDSDFMKFLMSFFEKDNDL